MAKFYFKGVEITESLIRNIVSTYKKGDYVVLDETLCLGSEEIIIPKNSEGIISCIFSDGLMLVNFSAQKEVVLTPADKFHKVIK